MIDLQRRPELVCPSCLGPLVAEVSALACPACARPVATCPTEQAPYLDFIGQVDTGARGVGPRLMHSRALAQIYQRAWRPAFTAIAGGRRHDLDEELRLVDSALASARGGLVLDLSCGPGHTARHLARGGAYARVYALDWSTAMLDQCAKRCRDQQIDVALIRADVARLPFASASIAGIHAGAALHVWPDPAAAAAEIGRVLRDGGGFIASTFAHDGGALPRRAAALFEWISDARVFDQRALLGLFESHGLEDIQVLRRRALILFWGRRRARAAHAR